MSTTTPSQNFTDLYRLYHSTQGMKQEGDPNNIHDVTLVRWKSVGVHPEGRKEGNCEIYGANTEVSDGDFAGIKHIYPWKGN